MYRVYNTLGGKLRKEWRRKGFYRIASKVSSDLDALSLALPSIARQFGWDGRRDSLAASLPMPIAICQIFDDAWNRSGRRNVFISKSMAEFISRAKIKCEIGDLDLSIGERHLAEDGGFIGGVTISPQAGIAFRGMQVPPFGVSFPKRSTWGERDLAKVIIAFPRFHDGSEAAFKVNIDEVAGFIAWDDWECVSDGKSRPSDDRDKDMARFCLMLALKIMALNMCGKVRDGLPNGRVRLHREMANMFVEEYTENGQTVSPHWRNPHFRRYPLRPDGTRRDGIVFVSGCVVGADMDNKTLEQSRSA